MILDGNSRVGNAKVYCCPKEMSMEKEISLLKEELLRERLAVDFYANKANYLDTHKGAPRFMCLVKEDGEKKDSLSSTYGGKLARDAQSKRKVIL